MRLSEQRTAALRTPYAALLLLYWSTMYAGSRAVTAAHTDSVQSSSLAVCSNANE